MPQVADGTLKTGAGPTRSAIRATDLHQVETTARQDGDGWVLSGAKSVVLHGDSADRIFVTARTAGGTRDEGGIGIFLVDAKADGLSRRGYVMQDGQRGAEIRLDRVRVSADELFGDPENGLAVLRRVVDAGIAALCAEAIGAMDVMRELTVDYIKTRKQFGVPIGAFQVLQHAAVDMFVATEQARSLAVYATMMADSEDADETRTRHARRQVGDRQGRQACGRKMPSSCMAASA